MRLFEKDGRRMAARTDIQAAAFLVDGWKAVVPVESEAKDDKDSNQEAEPPGESEAEDDKTQGAPKRGRKPKEA